MSVFHFRMKEEDDTFPLSRVAQYHSGLQKSAEKVIKMWQKSQHEQRVRGRKWSMKLSLKHHRAVSDSRVIVHTSTKNVKVKPFVRNM